MKRATRVGLILWFWTVAAISWRVLPETAQQRLTEDSMDALEAIALLCVATLLFVFGEKDE